MLFTMLSMLSKSSGKCWQVSQSTVALCIGLWFLVCFTELCYDHYKTAALELSFGRPYRRLGTWECIQDKETQRITRGNGTRGATENGQHSIVGAAWGVSKGVWPTLIDEHLKLLKYRTKAVASHSTIFTVDVVISVLGKSSLPMFADVIIRGGWGPGIYLIIYVKMNSLKLGEETVLERGANYETRGIPNVGHNVATYIYHMATNFANSSADFVIFTKTNKMNYRCVHDAIYRLVKRARTGKYQFITDPWAPYRIWFTINCDSRWMGHPMYAKVCPCKVHSPPWSNPWNPCKGRHSSQYLGEKLIKCHDDAHPPPDIPFVVEYWASMLGRNRLSPLVRAYYMEGSYGGQASVLRAQYPRSFWQGLYDSLSIRLQNGSGGWHDPLNSFFSTAFSESDYGAAPECSDASMCPNGWSMSGSSVLAIDDPLYRRAANEAMPQCVPCSRCPVRP